VNHQSQNQTRHPESPIQQLLAISQHDQQKHSRHDQKDGHVNPGGQKRQIGNQNQEPVSFGIIRAIHPDQHKIENQHHQKHGEPVHLGFHRIGPEGHGKRHKQASRYSAHIASQPQPQAFVLFVPSAGKFHDHQIAHPYGQSGGQSRKQIDPGGNLVEERNQ
jgi:hypothetical protein